MVHVGENGEKMEEVGMRHAGKRGLEHERGTGVHGERAASGYTRKDKEAAECTVDRRTRRTVAAIKSAFFEIAAEKGLPKVTVSDIAERADINRKTFYHHYDSIEALINEILEEEAKTAANSLREGMLDEGGKIDVMRLLQILSIELAESARRNGAVLASIDTEAFIRHFEPALVKVASETIPEIYGDAPEEQMRFLVTFIFSGLINTYRRWLDNGTTLTMEELAEILSVLVSNGLAGFREYTKIHEHPRGLPKVSES
jgi:AcrR family transcriptional regulator